jgi:Tol biopolymer transport system component
MKFYSARRFVCWLIAIAALACSPASSASGPPDDKKEDKKKTEPFKIVKITQGMGLYALGALSPDRKFVFVLGQKADQSPNLYVMNVTDHSIRPPLTSLKWGVADPAWSPDGQTVAFAGFGETASFPDLYLLDLRTGKTRQMSRNQFSDKEPVFTPDGKRVLYTTDESPLPDAAFGILHVASVGVAGGKPEVFTEDEGSSVRPGVSADGKSALIVKVDEASGRHSLWQYGFDGKPQRSLTERKFARIHRYIYLPSGGAMVLWAQEEPEQQDNVYILDLKSGETRMLPDAEMPKRSPTVSPNGSLIAFIAPAERGVQLFVFNSTSGEVSQLTFKGANTHSPVFVTDDQILFGSDRDGAREIYLVDLSQSTAEEQKKKK